MNFIKRLKETVRTLTALVQGADGLISIRERH
jgi:hypothetical protein